MTIRNLKSIVTLSVLATFGGSLPAATDMATSPLVTSSSSSVQPNIMFVMDDSGSMNWDYLPDWANTSTASRDRNNSFNGAAYNPAITYSPPKYYNSDGTVDTTTYPSQTAANTTDWAAVKNDGYGVQSTTTSNLVNSAYFYTTVPGEYCTKPNLVSCTTQSAVSASHPYPAYLRWCDDTTHCQALRTDSTTWGSSAFQTVRMPSQYAATITVGGASPTNTSVSSITVNGAQILSDTTSSATGTSLASSIVSKINACKYVITGQCTVVGYSASNNNGNSSTVTIYSPLQHTHTPLATKGDSGTATLAAAAFGQQSGATPGALLLTSITSGINSYPYPGTSTKASTRTDCAGTTCTYVEEMTNYANWRAYYRTRMQMMKTAVSHAFANVGSNFRVGYMTINNNNDDDFINSAQFTAANKRIWYDRLFSASPSDSTPLRTALARIGKYYANKAGSTINGVDTVDPIQYSCQQNFTILSTDGYWNESSNPTNLSGAAIGNRDSAEPRPYNDGGTTTFTKTMAQTLRSTQQILRNTSQNLQTTTQPPDTLVATCTPQIGSAANNWVTISCTTQILSGPTGVSSCTPVAASSGNGYTATTCATNPTGPTPVASCSASSGNAGNNWTTTTCSSNNTVPTYVGTCTAAAASAANNWTTTTCTVSNDTGWVARSTGNSCTADTSVTNSAPTVTACSTNNGSTLTSSCTTSGGTTCYRRRYRLTQSTTQARQSTAQTTRTTSQAFQTLTQPANTPVQTCTSQTGSAANFFKTIGCTTNATSNDPVASCTVQTATQGNSWTSTTCPTPITTAGAAVESCTAAPASAANNYVATICTPSTSSVQAASCTASSASSTNSWTTTTCTAGASTGGTSNTLSDVAEYYYVTPLRTASLSNCTGVVIPPAATGNDVCSNDVPTTNQDGASWQHMTTFTLGLGASGYMVFTPDYLTASSGDYFDIKNGTSANPSSGICTWQNSGACNWPVPVSNEQTTIDDLWHAGVNGRGAYYSAGNPTALASGLSNALAGVSSRLGAAAAATTSNPNVTSGDNFVFSSTFYTGDWSGQLYRQQIDLTTGTVPTFDVTNASTYDWAAQAQLDSNNSRTIYTFKSDAANKLKTFAWANLTAGEKAHFESANISSLSQFCATGTTCLSAADQTDAAGANLAAFIAGDRTNEGASTDTTKYYRLRGHVLGDIVDAEALYVRLPQYQYTDAGYVDFVAAKGSRQGIVYAAANDGMLHAFNATTGAETWAYVPTLAFPTLYKLADKNYSAQHRFLVDGTPTAGDICPTAPATPCTSSTWKTILVGGMNSGGRGYYALDITDPSAPAALWEYTDDNLGYTYGNPIITKLADGTWVVLVASGYNNTGPGDGVGRLYVLNASTGALIRTISTGAGSTSTPSGLARINAWTDNTMSDNTTLRVYGGDLLGNLWRFDVNSSVGAAGYDAQLLTTFYSDTGSTVRQPITAKPELGDISGTAVVFAGTGRFLGTTDLADSSQQSFYAVKDSLGSEVVAANPRASGSGFVHQTLTSTTCPADSPATICTTGQLVRTSSSNAVDWTTNKGWYIDLPDSGERANTDPALAFGTLAFNTNVPNVSACTAGGHSWRYFLDYRTGASVFTSTTDVVSVKLDNALATRAVFVRLPNNTIVQLTRMSSGITITSNVPIGSGGGATRRVSWRELVTDR